MLINHSLPGEMMSLNKHPVIYLVAKKVCIIKSIWQLNFVSNLKERIYVMSNIVERNNETGTLCEVVVNDRMSVHVGRPKSVSCKFL